MLTVRDDHLSLQLVGVTFDIVVLDSGCTNTAPVKVWLEEYVKMLSGSNKKCVEDLSAADIFQLGDGMGVAASKKNLVLALIGENRFMFNANVIDKYISLAKSKGHKVSRHNNRFYKDEATMVAEKLSLTTTASGYYCISIYPTIIQDNLPNKGKTTLNVIDTFRNIVHAEKRRKAKDYILNLHVHSKIRLLKLITDAGLKDKVFKRQLENIFEECEVKKKVGGLAPLKVFNHVQSACISKITYTTKHGFYI